MLGENKAVTLFNGTFTANQDSGPLPNRFARGMVLVFDITAVPGVQTVTIEIDGYDPTSGKYWTILADTAQAGAATRILRVFPGLTAAANAVASDVLPPAYRVKVTHSGAGAFTYTAVAMLIGQ